jgi:hypothetical protein
MISGYPEEIPNNVRGNGPFAGIAKMAWRNTGIIYKKKGKACFDPNPDLHHHLLCRKCGK